MANPNVEMFLATRADARRRGDRSVEAAMTADLERLGYPVETTMAVMPEHAVPPRKRGRPPRPRCEHNKIVGRCVDCDEETHEPEE